MNALVFLALRAAHVLMAGLWIGSTVFVSMVLMPAIDDAGPSGGQVMMRIARRGIAPYMMILGASTVLTGLYLLWRFTGGFDPGVVVSASGMAFGIGGVSGILAGVIGGAIVGRSSNQVTSIMSRVLGMEESPAKGRLVQQAAALRRRAKIGSRVVILLQMVALVLMAVGHYV